MGYSSSATGQGRPSHDASGDPSSSALVRLCATPPSSIRTQRTSRNILGSGKLKATVSTQGASAMSKEDGIRAPGAEWFQSEGSNGGDNSRRGTTSRTLHPEGNEVIVQTGIAEREGTRPPAKVAIKDKRRITFVNIVDIVSVEAQGNYVLLHRRSGSTMLREAISTVARKMRMHGFIRIHRSVLINATHVESVETLISGDYRVVLFGDRRYTVTRSYKANLPQLAAVWFGSPGIYPHGD